MREKNINLLIYVLSKSGLFGKLGTSTIRMAKDLKVSQQTVSRKLREMEKLGLIHRRVTFDGLEIYLLEKSRVILKQYYEVLKQNFDKALVLRGKVVKGIGEGRYYITKYQRLIKQRLGIKAYPGTLNIKINKKELNSFLLKLNKIFIKGFKSKTRSFGGIKCYKVKINGCVEGAIVIPERSRHDENIIELISHFNLRKKLKLMDRKTLEVSA